MKNINKIMQILSEVYPSSEKTTLNRMRSKPDPFKVLIACLLSLRARDENTERVSAKLFEVADTPKKILALSDKELKKLIFSSGHFNKKAIALKHVSKELIDRFDEKVPKTREELISIKHIGPKTANIVLAFAYNKPVIAVDTHVHRIPNRLGWVETKLPEKTEQELYKILPKSYWPEVNSIFVSFGREICQPVSQKCSQCPISKYCPKKGVKSSR